MPDAADRALVVQQFDVAEYPGPRPTLDDAWLGIYQVLWWYVESPLLAALEEATGLLTDAPPETLQALATLTGYLKEDQSARVLHVREANDLRKSKTWIRRAEFAEAYIAGYLGVEPEAVPPLMDRMMKLPRWSGKQRNNPLGNGLRMLVSEVLTRWGNPKLTYPEESKATTWFPGIQMFGRSQTPSVDVAAVAQGVPRAVISCKWSIRHDRISDPTNECTTYKSAAVQQQQMDLRYYVVTNELDGQRLEKVLGQPCVDALVHVHLDLVEQSLGGLPPVMAAAREVGKLLDLTELAANTYSW